jgi:hypothetical protein
MRPLWISDFSQARFFGLHEAPTKKPRFSAFSHSTRYCQSTDVLALAGAYRLSLTFYGSVPRRLAGSLRTSSLSQMAHEGIDSLSSMPARPALT